MHTNNKKRQIINCVSLLVLPDGSNFSFPVMEVDGAFRPCPPRCKWQKEIFQRINVDYSILLFLTLQEVTRGCWRNRIIKHEAGCY